MEELFFEIPLIIYLLSIFRNNQRLIYLSEIFHHFNLKNDRHDSIKLKKILSQAKFMTTTSLCNETLTQKIDLKDNKLIYSFPLVTCTPNRYRFISNLHNHLPLYISEKRIKNNHWIFFLVFLFLFLVMKQPSRFIHSQSKLPSCPCLHIIS